LIALIYFAWFGSKFGNGQRPGHRFFNFAVVDEDGNFLSLPRSLLRCSILLAPVYLGTAVDATGWWTLGWLLDAAGFAILYL
jgi:uncharacterized RDD family membrane protein YckC